MKKMMFSILIACAFLASAILIVLPANAEGETISLSDPSGDVSNDGFTTDVFNNVDITALTMNTGSEVIVFEMKVLGIVIYENTDYDYNYFIYIDHDGDGDEESTIMVGINYGIALVMFTSDYGVGYSMSFDVSGNGTNTLNIQIPLSYIEGSPGITDIYGEADVWHGSDMADDVINEDFGVVPVDDDEPVDDDDEWDDDWDDDYETEGDPTEETPTDEAIEVSIDSYGMDLSDSGEYVEVEVEVDGTTSGTVVKCAWTTVTYMKDGTYEVESWEIGPEDMERVTYENFTFGSYFKGTGSGGEDDWSTWGYNIYAKMPKEEYEENNQEMDMENVTKMVWVVRAFSDDDMTMWNQDTKDVTDKFKAVMDGESTDDDDDLPGFELFGAVVAFIAVAGIGFAFRKRNSK